MTNFIITHLQVVTMAVALLITGVFALAGFRRVTTTDLTAPERGLEADSTSWAYKSGHWKKVTGLGSTLLVLAATWAFVPRGYEGVVFDATENGVLEQELSQGLHAVVPFKQIVANVDTRIQAYTHNDEKVFQHTFDTQEIRIPITVNYQISDASYVYGEIAGGPATLIQPLALRSLRTAIGQYELEAVAAHQAEINTVIELELQAQLADQGIAIQFVSILDTIPQRGIIAAIEEEKVAERKKLTAEHNRDIAFTNAEAAVFTAEGEGKAMERIALAEQARQTALGMSPSEYIWYNTWNGALPSVIADASQFILPLPDSPKVPVAEESAEVSPEAETTTTTTTTP